MKSFPDLLDAKHQKFCFDNLLQMNKTSPELENPDFHGWEVGVGDDYTKQQNPQEVSKAEK